MALTLKGVRKVRYPKLIKEYRLLNILDFFY